jgi:predicted MFS family arabinose efflux permease
LYVLPAYLGELGLHLGISEAQMGSITAAENLGIALASTICMLWLRRVDRRVLAVAGTLCCMTLNLVAFFGRSFPVLVVARFLTGLLGEGVLFSLAFAVLGTTRNPDRSFGIGLTAVVLFGSLVLGSSSYLDRVPYGTGALLPLAIVPVGILVALKWMPLDGADGGARRNATAGGPIGRLAVLAIAGMTVWFAAPGAFWTFAESAAATRGISAETISVALAVGNAAGLLGSVVAAWQGHRWGRFGPIAIATAGLALSVAAFERSMSLVALALALSAFNIAWNYGTVYEMALVAALDSTGRAALGIAAAQVAGFAAGGFISGFTISAASYGSLPIVVGLFSVAGLSMLAPCIRSLKPQPVRHG